MKGDKMNLKKLEWKKLENSTKYFGNSHIKADVKVNDLFGIRFQCGKSTIDKYYYRYVINGKKFGDYPGFPCSSLEEGKMICEEKYSEICDQIVNAIFI